MDCDGLVHTHTRSHDTTNCYAVHLRGSDSFLWVEAKRPNETIERGQMETLYALARQSKWLVLIVRMHPEDSVPLAYQRVNGDGTLTDPKSTDRADFTKRCSRWFWKAA